MAEVFPLSKYTKEKFENATERGIIEMGSAHEENVAAYLAVMQEVNDYIETRKKFVSDN